MKMCNTEVQMGWTPKLAVNKGDSIMTNKKWAVAVTLSALAALFCVTASAKDAQKSVKKAEATMMKACKKDFPDAVKGKSSKEVADWVESEEHGANADTFKKTKCYNAHESWEKAAGSEEGDKNEHNS